MRVGFDLDGVVYDFRQSISDYLITSGQAHCTVANARDDWDFYEGWGLDLDEFLAAFTAGVDAGHIFRIGNPMPYGVQATRDLAGAGHTIHMVTDRSLGTDPGASARATAAWLAEHGFVFHSLTISRDKTVVATDVFIEDKVENADALNAAGTPCYLINRPWNTPHDDHRLRVETLEQFVAVVAERASVAA